MAKRGRGRPKSQKTLDLEKHRVQRAAEGKSSRGRKSSPTSVRSLAKSKREAAQKQTALERQTPDKTLAKAGKPGLTPAKVARQYPSMKTAKAERGQVIEKGLHERGKSLVSYAGGGKTKYVRRTFQFKGNSPATVTVHQKHDADGDKFTHKFSARTLHTPTQKIDEAIWKSKDGARTKRVRFTQTKLTHGRVAEKTETREGRGRTKATRDEKGNITEASKALSYASMGAPKGLSARKRI